MNSLSSTPTLAIFDLGNVVFRIDWNKMSNSWSKTSGIETDILKERFKYDEYFNAFERGDISSNEFPRLINKSLNIDLSYKEFKEGWNAIYSEVIPEVKETLEQLQGKIKIVAYTNTNSIHNEVWPNLYKDVLKNFEQIFVSSEIGFRKPDANGFNHVLQACKTEPSQALFFDDRQENIDGARALGINAYLVDSDYVVSSVFNKLGY